MIKPQYSINLNLEISVFDTRVDWKHEVVAYVYTFLIKFLTKTIISDSGSHENLDRFEFETFMRTSSVDSTHLMLVYYLFKILKTILILLVLIYLNLKTLLWV